MIGQHLNLPAQQHGHSLGVIHGALAQLAGLFNGRGGRIQPGQRVEIEQTEYAGGRRGRLRRGHAQARNEFAKTNRPDITLVGIFFAPLSNQIPQFLLLRRLEHAARQGPGTRLQISLRVQQRQQGVAISLDPVFLHHHPGHGDQHQHIERIDRRVLAGGVRISGRGLPQFPSQRHEADIRVGRLRRDVVTHLGDRGDIGVSKTHDLCL